MCIFLKIGDFKIHSLKRSVLSAAFQPCWDHAISPEPTKLIAALVCAAGVKALWVNTNQPIGSWMKLIHSPLVQLRSIRSWFSWISAGIYGGTCKSRWVLVGSGHHPMTVCILDVVACRKTKGLNQSYKWFFFNLQKIPKVLKERPFFVR